MNEKDSQQDKDNSAAALYYDGKTTPKLTASGHGKLADEIIALAREYEVPLYENPELVEVLTQLEIGDDIPRELFICIAEIISFAYILQGKTPENWHAD